MVEALCCSQAVCSIDPRNQPSYLLQLISSHNQVHPCALIRCGAFGLPLRVFSISACSLLRRCSCCSVRGLLPIQFVYTTVLKRCRPPVSTACSSQVTLNPHPFRSCLGTAVTRVTSSRPAAAACLLRGRKLQRKPWHTVERSG